MKSRVVVGEKALVWAMLIMVLPMLGACQKDEINNNELKCPVTAIEGANDNVVGKWKLVKVRIVQLDDGISMKDYSCKNIIYDFKQDGSLVVNGAQKDVHSFENGEYSFVFSDTPIWEGMGDEFKFTLKIGSTGAACGINNNIMIVDYAPLDGNTYYFVRFE